LPAQLSPDDLEEKKVMAVEDTKFSVDPEKPTVVMTRTFKAPRRVVFKASVRPELLSRWCGQAIVSCDIDLRPGGSYRIVQRDPDGRELAFRGVYREIVVPERLVNTWIFEGKPDEEVMVEGVFVEHARETTFTNTMTFKSVAERDAFWATGVKDAAAESMDRLAEVLRTLT
jgi:uncharacterized protein YndB with AHSA1/START domain